MQKRQESPWEPRWLSRSRPAVAHSIKGSMTFSMLCISSVVGCGSKIETQASRVQQALATQVTVEFQDGTAPGSDYSGTAEATLRSRYPNLNYGSSSLCQVTGRDGRFGADMTCVMKWSLEGIPAGSTVQSASVTVRVLNGSSHTYDIFALLQSWDEASTTWNQASAVTAWEQPGAMGPTERGDVVGSISGGIGERTIELNAAGVALVQAWIDGDTNAGMVIANATNTDSLHLASSEHATRSYRPKLSITYQAAAGGSSGTGGSETGTGGSETGTGGSETGTGGSETGTGGSETGGGSSAGGGGAGAGSTAGAGTVGGSGGGTGSALSTTEGLLVAFIGDQGNNGNSDAVLNLIKSEGADATVHNGDFDYADNPSAWNARINGILGENYPYFAIVGNHDASAWNGSNGYASFIAARHARNAEMNCTGELGVKATCYFRGLYMVQSCVGTNELGSNCGANSSEQVSFIHDSLGADDSLWTVCSWHKNQNDMQVGTKGNEVGWQPYPECMDAGAIVSTGHEHSYSRTLTLTDVGNASAAHGATGAFDVIQLSPGSNFVFVSGLGGQGIRNFSASQHNDDTWWGSYYAANAWIKNGVMQPGIGAFGAFFLRFYVDGNPKKAHAYFKDINGRIVDDFSIYVP